MFMLLVVNVIIIVGIQRENIMLKVCVVIATINMEGQKSHGSVDIRNYMHVHIIYFILEGLC